MRQTIRKMGVLLAVIMLAVTITWIHLDRAFASGDSSVLTVINGGAAVKTFDADEIDAMSGATYDYSTVEPDGITKTYYENIPGATVEAILDKAGLNMNSLGPAATLTFMNADGSPVSLTQKQLTEDRYYFNEAGTKNWPVPAIISSPKAPPDKDAMRLFLGQRTTDEITANMLNNNVEQIILFIPVTNISGVPTKAVAGKALTLKGTVTPPGTTNNTIAWSIKKAGATGAAISRNTLKAKAAGTTVITATVKNGRAAVQSGQMVFSNYTKDFKITVTSPLRKVTLHANGGKFAGVKNLKNLYITKGKKLGKPTSPTRKGYAFTGWYTKKTGGAKVTSGLIITKNRSFYARWLRTGYVNAKCSSLHLRAGAGMTRIIAWYPSGTKVQILGKEGRWYKVKVGRKTGYMYDKYITLARK